MSSINWVGVKDNAQHVAGVIVGLTTRHVYTKEERGTRWFSTVAANLAKDGVIQWFPHPMIWNK